MKEKKEYKTVALLGAGAVGGYIIWGLGEKLGPNFCVLAKGDRKKRFEREGFVINGELYQPQIKTAAEARGVDLLIVALKYNALPEALDDIETIVGENTDVMSLMNGIDSEEIIAGRIDESHIIYSTVKVASTRIGNSVEFDPDTTIGMIYGEKDRSRGTERLEALNVLFEGTGLHYRVSDVIISEIWSKFRLNISQNLIQALLSVGVGAYNDSKHVDFLRQAVRDELDRIAEAKGINFDECHESSARGSKVKDSARYSTLQDLDAGRHTEIDMLSGTVMRMGKELGIPTPYNECVYHIIKALEEKSDGVFDYD